MFLNKDLIGQQEDIELFNNIGCLDTAEGRFTVWLAINHTPRIYWEFEAARGEYNPLSLSCDQPHKLTSWDGSHPQLLVEKPTFTFQGGPRRQSRGYAEQVVYGDINAKAHYFDAYLPNTDFLREATGGNLEDITKALKNESLKAEIGNGWSIELSTTQEALDWLKPEKQNRGSMITLKIRLFQTEQGSTKVQELATKSLADAQQLFYDLCLMLSYMNGGYVQPVYIIAKKFTENEIEQIGIEDVAALAEAPLIVPQEEIGQGFIRDYGIKDLLDFIERFPSFQQMLQTPHWREKWLVIIEWYFQAILRPGGRRRNVLLPVVANALGTLLENLAWIILNEDLRAKARIKKLLNRIGISGEDLKVEDFVDIRNHSTHAQIKKTKSISLTEIEQWEVVLQAVQWVDEVILWRLGYGGQYRERMLRFDKGIQPRYDLSLRDSNW